MYQALYRKWRPQTFADVIGQQHITDTLRAQLQSLQAQQTACEEDLRALQHLELVACRGRVVKKPAPKRSQTVDKLLDPYLE